MEIFSSVNYSVCYQFVSKSIACALFFFACSSTSTFVAIDFPDQQHSPMWDGKMKSKFKCKLMIMHIKIIRVQKARYLFTIEYMFVIAPSSLFISFYKYLVESFVCHFCSLSKSWQKMCVYCTWIENIKAFYAKQPLTHFVRFCFFFFLPFCVSLLSHTHIYCVRVIVNSQAAFIWAVKFENNRSITPMVTSFFGYGYNDKCKCKSVCTLVVKRWLRVN